MVLLRGLVPVCESCMIAKAKRRKVPKEASKECKAMEFNRHCFRNIAIIKVLEKLEGISISKPNWHILTN